MICVCGLPNHPTWDGGDFKVNTSCSAGLVLLQLQDTDGEQARVVLTPDMVTLLKHELDIGVDRAIAKLEGVIKPAERIDAAPPNIKVGDKVDYHSIIGGPVTSKWHTVLEMYPLPNNFGIDVAVISGKPGVVALAALTPADPVEDEA